MSPVYVYVMNKMFGHKVGVWTVCLNRSSWCAFVSAPPTTNKENRSTVLEELLFLSWITPIA